MMSKVIKMETVRSLNQIRKKSLEFKENLQTVAFVPTMGSLHKGHLSLIDYARINADIVIVSIFVNPIQFGRGEDYESYPSSIDADKKMLETEGVDLIFIPNLSELSCALSLSLNNAAAPIIAALSVQSSSGGAIKLISKPLQSDSKFERIFWFAATPPTIAKVFMSEIFFLTSTIALFDFSTRTSEIAA